MDFTIKKVELLHAISKCELASDSKHVTMAFRMMRVEARKKNIRFVSVGEFCSVDTVSKADDIKTQGVFNVSPQRLRDIAHSMPDGSIRITLKGSRVTVQSATSKRKATFENHTVDVYDVDDPGKEAQWVQIDSRELVRALKAVRAASKFEDSEKPVVSLLVPTEACVKAFGCNGHLISIVDTSIKEPLPFVLRFPEKAAEILAIMATVDDFVRVIATDARLYMENNDTLVSAMLPAYERINQVNLFMSLMDNPSNPRGPTLRFQQLHSGLKSVLAATGFAGSGEKGSRGYQLKVHLGNDGISIGMNLSEADSVDEFEPTRDGDQDLDVFVSSTFFDKLLSSISVAGGVDEMQSFIASEGMMLAFRSQGIVAGIMTENPIK